MRFHLFAGLVLGGALMTDCADKVAAPQTVVGQYRLSTVNDAALPQLVSATDHCDTWLVTGALSLLPDGLFLLGSRDSLDCSRIGAPPSAISDVLGGTYTQAQGQISLAPDGVEAGAAYQAAVSGDVLILTVTSTQPGPVAVSVRRFERVR
jgi:hypothetical protein